MKSFIFKALLAANLVAAPTAQITAFGLWPLCEYTASACAPEALHRNEYILLIGGASSGATAFRYHLRVQPVREALPVDIDGVVDRKDNAYGYTEVHLNIGTPFIVGSWLITELQ